jgi:hypothetical protein
MRAKAGILIVIVTVALAACAGPDPHRSADRSVPNETLLLRTPDGPLAVSLPSGDVLVDGRGAVASADGARIYLAQASGGGTVVRTIDAASGAETSSVPVPGNLQPRVVSADGRALALVEPLPAGSDAWTPEPRSTTPVVIADPTGGSEPARYRLRGNFEPEAFSTDGSQLFLIQYLPAESPSVYRVTVLDLSTGEVRPAVGPFKGPAERMPGTRLDQVPAVDGSKLFTLYTSDRPGFAPHDAPVPRNAVVSFVHVLSLSEGWAHCIGLPRQLWRQPASAEAMAVSPDGSTLYLVDTDKGLDVTMNTESLDVSGPYRVPLPAGGLDTTVAVSADGSTLFVGSAAGRGAVTAIDTGSFEPVTTWPTDGAVSGLGLSLDGQRLYVAVADGLEVLSARNGRALGDVAIPSPEPIQAISPIAG